MISRSKSGFVCEQTRILDASINAQPTIGATMLAQAIPLVQKGGLYELVRHG
jgi:hypothetical protein